MAPEREANEGMHEVDSNGDTITVNSTDNPDIPGGYYISQTVDDVKSTNVYDAEDNLVVSHPDKA